MTNDADIMNNFSKKLAEFRKKKGFTQAQLAEEAGMTSSAVSQYENGQKTPGIVNARRLADVLGVTMNDLCGTDIEEKWIEKPITALLTVMELFRFQVQVADNKTIVLSMGEDQWDYSSAEIMEFFKEYTMIQEFKKSNPKSVSANEMVEQILSYLEEKYKNLPGLPDYDAMKSR